ncbi:MAG: hypothetical protein ABI550_07140 [Ignavibacteriaceae bacterium]
MGRTNPTFTGLINQQEAQWQKFRKALRKEDQEIFDDLFTAPKKHLAACFYAINPFPFENIIMSMLLEERKLVLHLEQRVNELSLQVEKALNAEKVNNLNN